MTSSAGWMNGRHRRAVVSRQGSQVGAALPPPFRLTSAIALTGTRERTATMMTGLYYYICDNCGSIADISDGPHPEGVQWACGECESTALWEFTDKDKAVLHGRHIQDARFAAKMAGIDQARAAIDEHEAQR